MYTVIIVSDSALFLCILRVMVFKFAFPLSVCACCILFVCFTCRILCNPGIHDGISVPFGLMDNKWYCRLVYMFQSERYVCQLWAELGRC